MAGVLVAKAVSLIFAAEDLRYVAHTGTPHSWDAPFVILRLAKGAVLLSIIFLAWSGWPFLKACLQNREKRVLSVVLPLQVIANAAFAAAGAGGPVHLSVEGDSEWRGCAVLLVDVACGFGVMYAVARSMQSL